MSLVKSVIDARAKVLAIIRHPNYPKNNVKPETVEGVKGCIISVIQECSEEMIGKIVDTPEELARLNTLTGLNLEYDFSKDNVEEYYDDDPELRIAQKYIQLKERSMRKGMEFDLTLADIRKMYNRKRCQITGAKINLNRDGYDPNHLSFERIDNTVGYTKANTVIVARWVNDLKNELFEQANSKFDLDKKTLTDMIKMMEFYKRNL